MVVLGGGHISYKRGTPVALATSCVTCAGSAGHVRCNIRILMRMCCNIRILTQVCCDIRILTRVCCSIRILTRVCCNVRIFTRVCWIHSEQGDGSSDGSREEEEEEGLDWQVP